MNGLKPTAINKYFNDNYIQGGNVYVDTMQSQILVVEDDPFSQKLFSHIIGKVHKNDSTILATNYSDARRAIFSSSNLKLAIIDVFLDGPRSGIDLLNFLDRTDIDIPVIMTSSLHQESFYDMVRNHKQKLTYLKKPFNPEVFLNIIEQMIED